MLETRRDRVFFPSLKNDSIQWFSFRLLLTRFHALACFIPAISAPSRIYSLSYRKRFQKASSPCPSKNKNNCNHLSFERTAVAAALGTFLASSLSAKLSSRVPAYASLPRHHKLDLDSRLGSNVHAVASTVLAVVCVLSLWSVDEETSSSYFSSTSNSTPLALRTSALSFAALGLSLGYFAADLALVLRHAPALGGPEVVGHHAAALASLLVASLTGHGHAHTLALLISECTTPFVNARVYLERAGPTWKKSRTYAANGMAMVVVWAVGRVGLFAAFFAHLAAFPGAGAAGVLSMAAPAKALIAVVPPLLAALNAYWFVLIARGAWRTVSRRRTTEEEMVEGTTAKTAAATRAAATTAALPLPSMPPTAACSIQLQPSLKPQQQQQQQLRSRRRSSEEKRSSGAAAADVPLVAVTPSSSSPSTATAASLERAILHLWSLAPQPPTALPSLPPFPSLPALPPSFQSLPSLSPAAPFVAASDLAAALGDRVRASQAGEALAGISAVCRERAERAQGFVADAWAARRASAAAAFVR